MAAAARSTRLARGLLLGLLLLLVGGASCTRQNPAGVDDVGAFSHRRRVLQNPDLPSQRSGNPSWMSGGSGSSGSGGASSGSSGGGGGSSGSSGAQPTTYASSPVADVRIYNGGAYGANWIDSSYGVRPFTDYSPAGHAGGVAKCNVLPYGATTSFFDKSAGDFTGRRALELFVYRGSPDAAMPDITIALAGPDTACAASVHFSSLLPSADATASGWVKFWVPLDSVFGGGSAGGGAFQGCPASDGSYLASGSVVKVDLRNDNSAYDALVCVDDVRLAA